MSDYDPDEYRRTGAPSDATPAEADRPAGGSSSLAGRADPDNAWQRPTEELPWWTRGSAVGGPPPNAGEYGRPAGESTTAVQDLPPLQTGGYDDGGQPLAADAAPAPRRRRGPLAGLLAALLAFALVAVGAGALGAYLVNHYGNGSAGAAPVSSATVGGAGSSKPTESLAKVAAKVQPSVVSVTVTGSSESDEGSGVILRSDGMILTNNHVIAAAADGGTISVKFADGRTASAKIVGRDPSSDIALIKTSGTSGLTPATLAPAGSAHVGDTVLAVGSPLGLDGSVSAGIVSALSRAVSLGSEDQNQNQNPFGNGQSSGGTTTTTLSDAIQTDAPINPGNSGGPLVDDRGRVIGINTAIASLSSDSTSQAGSIGVGFAIPIADAKKIADQLIDGKTPRHALLGVSITDTTSGTGGALVAAVSSGSAAAKAGLKTGDVITKVDGTAITDATDLTAAVRNHDPGDRITITYTRSGDPHTTTATLGSSTS